jgi:hypothetical protein
MTKGLDAAQITATTGEVVRPVYFVLLDFNETVGGLQGGWVRACDAPFAIDFDADEDGIAEKFLGLGDIGGISAFEESVEGQLTSITVTLSGIRNSLVALALNYSQVYQGRSGKIFKGWLNEDHQLIGTPILAFAGIMDVMPIEVDGESASINLRIVSRHRHWENSADNPRWSNEDHLLRHPGDTYFENMPEIANGLEVTWPGS